MTDSATLLETALITITANAGVVSVVVVNRDDVEPAEGAECARRMAEVLNDGVLIAHSPYRGLLVDVRRAPAVFGPKTRSMIESVLRAAERHQMRVAIVVSGTTQRMQFDSMAGIYAPHVSAIAPDERAALDSLSRRSR